MTQQYGENRWSQPELLDGALPIVGTPSIAFTQDTGDALIAVLGTLPTSNHQAYLGHWTERSWSGFQHENTLAGIRNKLWLTATAWSVFLIATFAQGYALFKTGFDRAP
ncbi:hypothetical protein [Kitasatospora sp. NPDC001095]